MASEEHGQPPASPDSPVRVGDRAPDLLVTDATGQQVQLAEFWRERPVALVFIRHFG